MRPDPIFRLPVLACLFGAIACGSEAPGTRRAPPPPAGLGVQQVPLVPGIPGVERTVASPFAGDDRAINEGRRLYHWMNCSGCHFEGGGGIGPPLMDAAWIYGGRPDQIFSSVANGRANGMPAYGDKLVSEEIWRIVAYVETLNPDRESAGGGSGQTDSSGETSENGQGRRAG